MAFHEIIPESPEFKIHRKICKVCHHTDRYKIEEQKESGIPLAKLVKTYQLTLSSLKRHFLAIREEENRLDDQKRVSIRDFCEAIIKKCQNGLAQSNTKVSIRDALNAANLLTKLGEGERIDEIWKAIESGKAEVATITQEVKLTKQVGVTKGI